MSLIRVLLILLITATPPVILLTYDRIESALTARSTSQNKQTQSSAKERYETALNEGFTALEKAYHEEFKAYRQSIEKHWGEFVDPPPSVWVSYDESNNIRRSVDYRTGEVQVEMLVEKRSSVGQSQNRLNKAVFRLLNTTEKKAFETDVVANRVEQRLSGYTGIMQKGQLSDEPLFSTTDLVSLSMNHDGFIKVAANTKNIAITDKRASAKKNKDIVRVSFKIPHSIRDKAMKYAAAVTVVAEKEKIDAELIFAIMETESNFNPMAKSHIPAYGLMQIVPRTAGKDATSYLYGKAKILAPSYLYQPANNIKIGVAYLHVLHYKYLRRVKNRQSRMYCTIAAYNAGASIVAKAFIDKPSFNRATPEVNKLSPQQIYDKLVNFLPTRETREYVDKVTSRMKKYIRG